MQRYDRSSVVGLTMTTVNPCNNFIIDYLIRNKIKADKQVSNKYYMYNLAIESVRKYPLPLICQEQLAALEGFGNFFINRVGKLMKRHYLRGRMPTEGEMLEDDQDHLEGIRENLRKIKQGKKEKQEDEQRQANDSSYKKSTKGRKRQEDSQSDSNQNLNETELIQKLKSPQEEKDVSKKSNFQPSKFELLMMSNNSDQKVQAKSSRRSSVASQQTSSRRGKMKRQIYKPRKGTQPFQILKAILELEKRGKKPAIKGDINQYMFNKRKQKMKGWTPVRDRLIQFGFVTQSRFNQDQVTLTEKGKDYIYEIENKQSDSDSSRSNSSESQIRSHSKKKTNRSEKQSQTSKSRKQQSSTAAGETSTYSKTSYTQSKGRKLKHRSKNKESNRYGPQVKIKKEQLIASKAQKDLVILYNEKSQLNQKDEDRIIELFNQNKEIKYRQQALQIGDFVWEIGSSILDIIVFRIKCQNFDLDQYFLQCQLAKQSQCENVYFVFEQTISSSKTKIMDTKTNLLSTVIADSRVAGFKIVKSTGLGQTISFISKVHSELLKKIKMLNPFSASKILLLGTLAQIRENIRQFKPALLRNVTINCLQCLPNMTRQMIKKIIKKMPSLSFILQKLKALRCNSERKNFLLWYLKEFKPKKGTIRLIIDLMFYQDYDDN